MHRNKKRLYRIFAIFLAFLLAVGHLQMPGKAIRIEPEDPITTEPEVLLTEDYSDQVDQGYLLLAETGTGDGDSEAGQDENQNEEESEEETQSEEQKPEEETQPDEQKPDEEEKAEEQDSEDHTGEDSSDHSDESKSDGSQSGGKTTDENTSGGDQPGNNETNTDSGNGTGDTPGTGEDTGNTPGDGDKKDDGSQDPDQPQPVEPDNPDLEEGLVTDLSSKTILFSELTNDQFSFYAYYTPESVDANLRVKYRAQSDTGNGTWLRADGHNYSTKLKAGKNEITVSYKDSKGEKKTKRYIITYEANKADERTPEIGENPPTIETNLDDWEGYIQQQNFTFLVKARTWQGEVIRSNHIRVTMDGQTITNPTGSSTYEYALWFERPNNQDIGRHVITVMAWDDEGNSKFVKYTVETLVPDDGEVIGSVTVVIDATTVDLGIIDEADGIELIQGETAADALLKMLDEYGYTANYSGSAASGFYLRSLERADTFAGAEIEEHLQELLERDNITFTSPCSGDQLGEFDFTRGSGWMYSVNGSYAAGKGMSEYHLNDGDTLYLRFTLAYGKDIGGSEASGGTEGSLSGYCGTWINGSYHAKDHKYEETDRKDPEPGVAGYIKYTCKICGDEKTEDLDPLPENPDVPDPDKPDPDQPNPDQPDPDKPNPDQPNPDQPDPDKPDPDQPDPDKPDPDQPDPDKPDPDQPDPDQPDPDKPDPDQPDPDKPDPDQPDPDKPDPGQPDPDQPDPDQPDPEPDKPDPEPDKPDPDPAPDQGGEEA